MTGRNDHSALPLRWGRTGARWTAIGVVAGLLAIWTGKAAAFDFTVYDVPSTPNSVTTALTHDHVSNGVYVGYTTVSYFYTAARSIDMKWYPHLEAGSMKQGRGTICVSNWPQNTEENQPSFAMIRTDGTIVRMKLYAAGGYDYGFKVFQEVGNTAQPAVTVSMADNDVSGTSYAFTRSNGDLWFKRISGSGVVVNSVLIATDVAGAPSIAVATDGSARIAYRNASTTRLVYAMEGPNSAWTFQYVSPDDGDSPSLQLDSNNRPLIAYHSNQGLMFADGAGFPTSAFIVNNVLSGPQTGIDPSLQLTPDLDYPWIASCDQLTGTVNFSQRPGGLGNSWVNTVVSTGLSTPMGTSLRIGGLDQYDGSGTHTPEISYSSSTGGIDYATGGVFVARIQDQGLEGQTFKTTWGGTGPVIVETSTDGGTSYQEAVETSRSPVFFTLPAVQTDAARIRIRRPSDGAIAISPNTFRIVPRTTPPSPANQRRWQALGSGGERRGTSLANAGDVNGDGYDDLITGAPLYASPGAYTGRAYLYFGGPASDNVADLTLSGPEAGSLFGNSVAGVGDLNGDGYADFAVGVPYFTSPAVNTGRVYVYYGGPSPDASPDLVLSGTALGETFGTAVAGLGDVNGDGFDDMAAGAPAHNGAGGALVSAGRVDVFFGGPGLDAARDQSIEGEAAFDKFGSAIAGGGDVNGDGWFDFLVGAPYGDASGAMESGTIYLFLGGPLLDGLADAIQHGSETGGQLGYSLAIAGDVNGDGLADIAAGAPFEKAAMGRGYLWGGSRSWVNPGPANISTSPGPPNNGVSMGNFEINPGPPEFVLSGETPNAQLGISVAAMGDLNGDCYAEVGFGSPWFGAGNQGRAYIVLGGTAPDPQVRVAVEGSSANGLGMGIALAGLRRSSAGSSARAAVAGAAADGSGFVSLHDFAPYLMQSVSGGGTWPVGALREIRWLGRDKANIDLSVDGGATWVTLLTNVGGEGANVASVRVPHTPTKFARIRALPPSPVLPPSPILPPNPIHPCTPETWVAVSDSFFTIQTSVSLLALLAAPAPQGAGAIVTWSSDPGPEDLSGYRLERANGSGPWTTIVPLTRETAFDDPTSGPAARYRLYAVNGLGEELELGETAFRPRATLAAWPLPYHGGEMSIAFATHGGWGGGSGRSEVTLFDVQGRLIRRIIDRTVDAGYQSATWDGRDEQGRTVATGIYFLRSESAGERRTLKIVVAR